MAEPAFWVKIQILKIELQVGWRACVDVCSGSEYCENDGFFSSLPAERLGSHKEGLRYGNANDADFSGDLFLKHALKHGTDFLHRIAKSRNFRNGQVFHSRDGEYFCK